MSADASPGPSQPLPTAKALAKPDAERGSRGITVDPRVLLIGGGVALIGVAVFILFVWMVPSAAARELQAACRGLRPEPELNPALCPGHTACAAPTPAPDFTAKDITGKDVKLSDYRGKVVLLNFWASWCGVCKTEKPQLDAMAHDMVSDDFVVLALASDHKPEDAENAVLDALAPQAALEGKPSDDQVRTAYRQALPDGTPFKLLLDPPSGDENIGKIASSMWGIKAVPESALIDRKGNIRAYFGNKRDWRSSVAQTCLRSVIDGE